MDSETIEIDDEDETKPAQLDAIYTPNSSNMLTLQISEIGDPVPFKIVKLEPNDDEPPIFQMEIPSETKWMVGSTDHEAGPSDAEKIAQEPHSTSSPPPSKRLKTKSHIVQRPPHHRLRLENRESMEIRSSDDDAFSTDSDMEYGNDSDSDSQWEYTSDEDPLGPGAGGDQKVDDVDDPVNLRGSEVRADWTSDETSIKKLKFTKKRELLIPPPKEPYETFRWFLNDQILDTMVTETNKYAAKVLKKNPIGPASKWESWRDVTREEMITFLGLLIHTGTIRMNRLADYWRGDYLFNLNCFSRFMTHNRFMLILNCLYFTDSNTNEKDQIAKIEPIIKNLNDKMNEIYYPGKELIVTKSMVFWQGRLVRQEYTDHRRHRNAINVYMLAEPNGIVSKFQVYVGISSDKVFRVTTSEIVMKLVEEILGSGHSVYMDKYFSSYGLAQKLLMSQTYCTGTLYKKARNNPFKPTYHIAKKYFNKSFFSNGVQIGKWRGNSKSILYITTEFKNKLRDVVVKNSSEMHPQPIALMNFSKHMTRNELLDQLMLYLPCSRKRMRWYRKLFIYALQIYMSNAMHLFNKYSGVKKKMDFYEYRLSVLKAMLPHPLSAAAAVVPQPLKHALTRITKTGRRQKRDKDGTMRIVKEVSRKDCKQCRKKKRRTATQYECMACEGSPAYCTTCFCEVHVSTNTPYEINLDEESL